jgi:hypothetical protein
LVPSCLYTSERNVPPRRFPGPLAPFLLPDCNISMNKAPERRNNLQLPCFDGNAMQIIHFSAKEPHLLRRIGCKLLSLSGLISSRFKASEQFFEENLSRFLCQLPRDLFV